MRFKNLSDLIEAFEVGDVYRKDCTIYFDGGEFFITHKSGTELISGNPEQALAEALGLEIGYV